jgi:hypothetical protein
VRDPLEDGDIEFLEVSARTPAAHRQAAATLQAWAAAAHPDDDVTTAELLCAAGWHLGEAGDTGEALDVYRRAVADGSTATIAPRCLLVAALLEAGQHDEAQRVADDFRRSKPDVIDFAVMAEAFEAAGDLRQAHRWVGIGVSRLEWADDRDLTVSGGEVDQLLRTRRRIRAELGFPPDGLDEIDA